MKPTALSLLAIAACFLAEGSVSGQQDCDCNQVDYQSADLYQPTQWNSCELCNSRGRDCQSYSHGGRNCTPHGSRLASLWTRPLFPRSCAARCCATKSFPDAGWNAPAHLPVNYDGAWYGSYAPQNAYGTSGGGFIANYPTVYQPTDTTQLGYYYNKVPTWQTRTDMIPPTPNPDDFHSRIPHQRSCGFHSYQGVRYAPVSTSCQNCNNGN
jgi:hypothetical protein